MECTSCGAWHDERARFCPSCGQRVPARRPTVAGAGAGVGQSRSAGGAPPLPREELDAAVAARRELGPRMEPEVVDAFLERVEHAIDARVDARVAQRAARLGRVRRGGSGFGFTSRLAASLALGIPLTAVAGEYAHQIGPVGIIAVWASIVVMNIYYTEVEKQRD